MPLRAACARASRIGMRLCAAGTQEGDNLAVFPFLRINPFPSGRAARTKISGAFRLPPICRITVSTTAATPWRVRSVRLHTGTRPERRLHENGSHKPCIDSTPAFQIRREAKPPRRYRKIKFFHSMWTNLFAVAGSRKHPSAGVIDKRGTRPPLARSAAAQAALIFSKVICEC